MVSDNVTTVSFSVQDVPQNIQAVKLELGTISTLAYDPPMDRAVELAKCQRYYIEFGGTRIYDAVAIASGVLLSATQINFVLHHASMRTQTPTLTFTDGAWQAYFGGVYFQPTGFIVSGKSTFTECILLFTRSTGFNGFGANVPAQLYGLNPCQLSISSDL